MMLMAYLSCMLAELLDFSGILTVFFCGIVMSHYTWHNVTESSRVTTKHAFATLSFISEIFLFLYVGMDALDIEKWKIVDQTYRHTVSLFLSLHCSTRRSFF
ncbi:Sodium/hydrogen exchanger 2 [Zea mays]|uniref:Sodium/hydrogen exchanger 2 n=2 Tax=Zea mays TaxID=4577 RepID=A0A1D6J4H5_MAIZE|nr:Sodium/hydrogen exchanger 2 [Zea mays]